MKSKYVMMPICAIIFLYSNCMNQPGAVQLNDKVDSLSYIIGRDVGEQLHNFGAQIRMAPFALGVEEAIKEVSSRIDPVTEDSLRQAFANWVQQKVAQEQMEQAQQNKMESDSFLEQNKQRPEVITTQSGLQYRIMKKGNGAKPSANDTVVVHYKGMLLNNTVFDSTEPQQPVVIDLQRVIPGLQEGIQLMNEGSVYRFFLPPDLAYGSSGVEPVIPPNAALIFDVELVSVGAQ